MIRDTQGMVPLGQGIVSGVPYVWQEINGFCNWAGTSILLQSVGVDADLHDVLALTGVGFSFAYIRYNDTILIYPGAFFQQIFPVKFVTDLYGLNYTLYFGDQVPSAESQLEQLRQMGVNAGLIRSSSEAFSLIRSSIDSGNPVLISVDPRWLPISDYDILRARNQTGGGHGVVVVGYDDTAGTVTIIDPGVGSFGADFGYPYDGRGNYSQISYTALESAWSSRYYISVIIKPGGTPVADATSQIGPYVRDLLLGDSQRYAPGSQSAFLWSFGERGFRKMSADMTADVIRGYLGIFDGIANERQFKTALLRYIGIGIEAQVTLQYLAYRAALYRLPKYLVGVNLTEFIQKGELALPHFAALSNNKTLIDPGNLTACDGLASTVLRQIAEHYNSTGNIDVALETYSQGLAELSSHLLGIADSWRDAGLELAEIWPNDFITVYGPYIVVGGVVVGLVVVLAFWYTKRRPSQ